MCACLCVAVRLLCARAFFVPVRPAFRGFCREGWVLFVLLFGFPSCKFSNMDSTYNTADGGSTKIERSVFFVPVPL